VTRFGPPQRYRRMRVATALACLAFAALPLAAAAQPAGNPTEPLPSLTVPGEGEVERSPDVAHVSVQIITTDDNAAASAGKNTTIYDALKAKLGPLALASDAIRTTYFNVQYIPYPPKTLPPEQRQARYGYVTTRGLQIAVAPIEAAGKVVDAATAAGVTDVGGVTYDLRDRRAAYREALGAAMQDARRNAEALAAAGDFHLVRIRSVSTGFAPIRVGTNLAMTARGAPEAAPPPTDLGSAGPIVISTNVTLVYDIR